MKKVSVILIALMVGVAFTFSSCKKCSTCKYTYDLLGVSQTYEYPEECGKKNDIDAYEQACKDAAALAGGSCTCD